MDKPLVIDTLMHGSPGVTAAYVVRGDATALVETGPKSRYDTVNQALADHGVETLDWIVVTHIHLDHAGAAGTFARRFPEARVAVHEVGAPHLIDPSKLWSSASRIYGDQMDSMWGGIDPIDEGRIHVLRGNDQIDLGGRVLRAVETPGHARHHHAILDEGTGVLFTGDALGVKLQGIDAVRPATPPPEFNLEEAKASIETIRGSGASELWPTHFGPGEGTVDDLCDKALRSLDTWAGWVEEARSRSGSDVDDAAEHVGRRAKEALEAELPREAADRLEMTTSYRMNTWGYMRYYDKKESA